jgi:hypothetical protein
MPVSVNLDRDSGILIGTGSGPLTLADGKAAVLEIWSRREWNGRPIVWDFRDAQIEFSIIDVQTLAQFILSRQSPGPPARLAIVTGRDVDFGLSRMFEAFRESASTEVHIFRGLNDAISWARAAAPPADQ